MTEEENHEPLEDIIDQAVGKVDDLPPPPPLSHTEPAADPISAAHGVRKFRPRFADAEVQGALDQAAASGVWYVSIHFVEAGMIRHWFKPSDKFPINDTPKCARGMAEDAERRLTAQREAAEVGLAGLKGINDQPGTFADEND